jgi:hypothetical protein
MHCATCRLSKQRATRTQPCLRYHHLLEVGVSLSVRYNTPPCILHSLESFNTAITSSMASFPGSRGGFAPRRGRGRGGRASLFTKTREPMKPDLDKHPLGDLVKEFHSSDLSLKPIDLAEISDCQYVASYNWLNDEVPTIVVPGNFSSLGAGSN